MANLVSSAVSPRSRAVAYWATTAIIAAELAVGGVWDVLRIEYVREVLERQLGYPTYFAVIMGVWKVPGAVALLAPRLPRLKEWAYAGAVFTYSGAAASHLAVGDGTSALGPTGFAVIALASWALRPPARRELAPGPGSPGARSRAGALAVSDPDDTLHEVTEVAVIRHLDLGVLLLHSNDRRWHFPDSTVRVGDPWDESLRRAVRPATGIRDLRIGPVLLIQNFGPGEVDERPQFGIFFLCTTHTPDVAGPHRWVQDAAGLDQAELFHPLVADLIGQALDGRPGGEDDDARGERPGVDELEPRGVAKRQRSGARPDRRGSCRSS